MGNGESEGFRAFFDVAVQLRASLGGIHAELKRARELAEARIPIDEEFHKVITYPASGTPVARLFGPPMGMVGHLRRVSIVGQTGTDTTTVTGTLYVRGSPPYLNGDPGVVGFVDQTATAPPIPAFYSIHQVVIRHQDHLYVALTGGTAGHLYTITGNVEVYDSRIFSKFIE